MIPIKVQCVCGQKYAFDVEPVNGRMPQRVKCPVCGAEGTAAANEIIARTLAAQTPPSPALSVNRPAAPAAAPIPTKAPKAPVKKSKAALWIGAGAGGVALAAAVAGFIWLKHPSANSQSADKAVPAATKASQPTKPAASSPPGKTFPSTSASAPNPKMTPAPENKTSPENRLKELKAMFDQGMITKEVYDQKRQEILKSL